MQRLENWDDLRYFLAVAREGTLGAAARGLGVNQSTVFRRIDQLEQGLGTRLFDRRPRGYTLTAKGENMVALATRIEDDVLALDREVSGSDQELKGTIRITTVDEIHERIVPHFRTFRDRYPKIDLEVNTDLRLFSLSRREADIALRPGAQPTQPEIMGRKLVRLAAAVYASQKYLAKSKRPRRRSDLANHCLISFDDTRKHASTEQWLRANAPNARVGYRASSMLGQLAAARADLGVAILPCFMGDPDPILERLFLVTDIWDYHLWLLVHADLRQAARVRAFSDFISQTIVADRCLYEGKQS